MHRKTVTVVFCDVVGSTTLGESVDPEALQEILARYFERMKTIVERHGGTVEKFIGDAVMAVFGVPVAHEDDAYRALRAAAEMRDAFPELGVQGRIGVNTGEVVVDTSERLATGDAVNVAARLQQAAEAGEVLIGRSTFELARGAVEVEDLGPLAVKGKAEPVPAHRLVQVFAAPERRHDVRFVGRTRELALIHDVWERAHDAQRCEVLTILGDAGIGKSRLVAEALAPIEDRVVRGRCLPYGEGITYWPLVEVIKQLDALPSEPAAAAAIRSLLGETEQGTSSEEIAWAFRKLLEEQAPVVVVFDDIQWGEDTFLDLVDGVSLLSSGAAILLVCVSRPELMARRSEWPVTLRLEPLPDEAVDELIGRLSTDLRVRVSAAAGGNPLFLTEMLAMAEEIDDVEVPPTLRALLAARLDQLDPAERRVLEGGSVEGEVFHRGAVQALTPEEDHLTRRLAALIRKGLIRPDRAQLLGEDAFRFRHLLIRDAAYDALPKATRADLHERFAAWLEGGGADLVVELDEILGYHLEQAARYKQELGQADPALADRAGDRLAAAGRRALWRGDLLAAISLIQRSLELTRPSRIDIHLELDLVRAHELRRDGRAGSAVARAAAERARAADDAPAEMLARVADLHCRMMFAAEPPIGELEVAARSALSQLDQAGDHAGLAHVWLALGEVANLRCRYEDGRKAVEQMARHARLGGQHLALQRGTGMALAAGPRPADEALATLDAALSGRRLPRSLLQRALLLAMLGRFDEAWDIGRDASLRLRELTGDLGGEPYLAGIANLAGDYEEAARYLRVYCDLLERRGNRAELSTYAPELGRCLCLLGRFDEAEPLAQLGRELGAEHDVRTQMMWRQVQALVLAQRGEHAEAEQLAREAVELTEQTDALAWQGNALWDLAEVLHAAGRTGEAVAALEQALDRYERKKNVPLAERTRDRVAALTAHV